MKQLLLATRNRHKTQEFAEILGDEFVVRDLSGELELPVVEETGATFEENAILKAVAASRHFPEDVVADDSGLEVEALNGAPGIFSARYAGEGATDAENIAKLLGQLATSGGASRVARFRCVLARARQGKVLAIFHGAVEGKRLRPTGNRRVWLRSNFPAARIRSDLRRAFGAGEKQDEPPGPCYSRDARSVACRRVIVADR